MSILLMAPYPELYKQAREVIARNKVDVVVEQGDLGNGLTRALEVTEANNIDIVISRGGTASLLRKHLNRIVIEIPVTGYDLLRAIYPHFVAGKRIAVVGYMNIIYGVQSIAAILNADLGIFTVTQSSVMEEVIADVLKWGAEVIVGDAVSTALGKGKGVTVELIKSGEEAIENAIQNAIQVHDQIIEKIATLKRMNSIFEHSQNGIIYIDSAGEIKQLNEGALVCLKISADQLLHKKVGESCLPDAIKRILGRKGGANDGAVVKLGAETVYVKTIGIDVGKRNEETIVFIHDTGKIQKLEAQIRKELSEKGLQAHYSFETMITGDPINKVTINKAKQYSLTDSTVLLLGETGTGKEFFAQSIHNHSARKNGPFVAVNCAALPDTLLESELFGYIEGAFTGANKGGRKGLFELAHLGTIFLDEINEMNTNLQARFLRVLQEKEIMRIGDNKVISIDVRVIAATNKDLYREVQNGRFRSDLYYRIKVLDIEILPLRKRPLDIYPLFQNFIHYYAEKHGYSMPAHTEQFVESLARYSWPGNIRELKNFSEKFVILSSGGSLPKGLIEELLANEREERIDAPGELQASANMPLEEKELEYIRAVMLDANYNISHASRILGISRGTLRRKLNSKA